MSSKDSKMDGSIDQSAGRFCDYEEEEMTCAECCYFDPCPCGCECGWCSQIQGFAYEDDTCMYE